MPPGRGKNPPAKGGPPRPQKSPSPPPPARRQQATSAASRPAWGRGSAAAARGTTAAPPARLAASGGIGPLGTAPASRRAAQQPAPATAPPQQQAPATAPPQRPAAAAPPTAQPPAAQPPPASAITPPASPPSRKVPLTPTSLASEPPSASPSPVAARARGQTAPYGYTAYSLGLPGTPSASKLAAIATSRYRRLKEAEHVLLRMDLREVLSKLLVHYCYQSGSAYARDDTLTPFTFCSHIGSTAPLARAMAELSALRQPAADAPAGTPPDVGLEVPSASLLALFSGGIGREESVVAWQYLNDTVHGVRVIDVSRLARYIAHHGIESLIVVGQGQSSSQTDDKGLTNAFLLLCNNTLAVDDCAKLTPAELARFPLDGTEVDGFRKHLEAIREAQWYKQNQYVQDMGVWVKEKKDQQLQRLGRRLVNKGLMTAPEVVDALRAEVEHQKEQAATFEAKATAFEQKATTLEAKSTTLEAELSRQKKKSTTLEEELARQNKKSTTLEEELSRQKKKCTTLEEESSRQKKRSTTLEDQMSTLQTEIAQYKASQRQKESETQRLLQQQIKEMVQQQVQQQLAMMMMTTSAAAGTTQGQ
ncbi:hypothetical protein DFH27DRAFT_656401 [Peziza echinospora]|nr:hypothetical protein DFH27DRAFT_656401 [Peziza echinospora]